MEHPKDDGDMKLYDVICSKGTTSTAPVLV